MQLNHIYCVGGGSKVPFLPFGSSVFWVSHARFSSKSLTFSSTFSSKVSYQNLVSFVHFWAILVVYKKAWLLYLTLGNWNWNWNTQKSKWTIPFECQGKMFLSIEKVFYYWKDNWGPTLNALPCFSPHFWDKVVTFDWAVTWEIW